MSLIEEIIRPDVREMSAYPVPDSNGFLKLDAMENPFPLPDNLKARLGSVLAEVALNRYPVPSYRSLKAKIRQHMGIPEGYDVVLGNGSDELISIIALACARKDKPAKILAPVPSFVMYALSAQIAGMEFVGVPLKADLTLDLDAMLAAIASGRVGKYVTDFPNEKVVGVDNIIALPHLGACTPESEEKSAVMAARELYDYLANGNIKNSVNFPDATLERMGVSRVCILHQNVPTMLNQFLEIACSTGLNVENMINKAYGAYAYAMMDLNGCLDDDQIARIDRIPEVIRVRVV